MATLNEWLASSRSRAVNVREEAIALVARIDNAQLEANVLNASLTASQTAVAAAQTQCATLQSDYDAYKAAVLNRWGPMGWADWDETQDGTPLDLTGYVETFRDDFNEDTIVNVGQVGGKWWAAGHSNFGEVSFRPDDFTPDALINNPDGTLTIRMEDTNGATAGGWQSSIIQTVDRNGVGFSQSMGYWEVRMKLPTALKAAWPAFWLLSVNEFTPDGLTNSGMELDIMEAYASDPAGLHCTIHYKQPRTVTPGLFPTRQTKSNYVGLRGCKRADGSLIFGANASMFDGQFHKYAVKMDTTGMYFYFDDIEVCRYPFLPFMATPMYGLVNLAILPEEKSLATGTMDLTIDYVRAMAK